MSRSWFQLFRAPNLFTVPGDPIAGFLLTVTAGTPAGELFDGRLAWAMMASLCFYAAGLAMNDLFDLEEDRRDRPNRPLTSGAIPLGAARLVTMMLVLVGLAAMAAAAGRGGVGIGLALIGCVLLYNAWAKRLTAVGALVMGACRGLSVMCGATAATGGGLNFPGVTLSGAALVTAYIAAVTNLARHETKSDAPVMAKILPTAVLLMGGAAFGIAWPGPERIPGVLVLLAAGVLAAGAIAPLLRTEGRPVPPIIGSLIRLLLVVQAGLCVLNGLTTAAVVIALFLLALQPVARRVGKAFYAS